MRSYIPSLFLILACAAGLAACKSPGAPSGLDLEGTEWFLTSLNGRPAAPGTRVTLAFQDHKATGYSGCNW
ncbi:MAG: META domain-containing protein, partial [Rudaea sp.]